MCDKAILLRSKCLQGVFEVVNKTKSWDSINWNQYPTVPVHDPDKRGLITIRNALKERGKGIVKHILDEQRKGIRDLCDANIYCSGGFIPCHTVILMHFSSVLEDLIKENIREIGVPSEKNPVCIFMNEFELKDMERALLLFYNGFSSFPASSNRTVNAILDILKVKDPKEQIVCEQYDPSPAEEKKNEKHRLLQYAEMSDESEDENNPVIPEAAKDSNSRTGEWVNQTLAQTHAASNKENESHSVAGGSGSAKTGKKNNLNTAASNAPSTSSIRTQEESLNSKATVKHPVASRFTKVQHPLYPKKPPQPRIQRKTTSRGRKSSSSAASASTKTTPVPESKPAPEQSNKGPYERDEDFELPPSESESEKEASDLDSSGEIDGDELHLIERRLRLRTRPDRTRKSREGTEKITVSIAEALKTNPRRCSKSGDEKRYPERLRKEVDRYRPDELPHISSEALIPEDSDVDPGESPMSHTGSSLSSLKCFYCKVEFKSEEALDVHSVGDCGKHLKGQYSVSERKCFMCNQQFESMSHQQLISHVNSCYMDKGTLVSASSMCVNHDSGEDDVEMEDEIEEETTDRGDNAQNLSGSGEVTTKIFNAEKIPVGHPRVVMEKLADDLICRIIDQIQNGGKVDIPRLRGYNYVRVVPKKELPEFYPDDDDDMTLERLRQLEREQEESRLESERRQQLKKQQQEAAKAQEAAATLRVPPLVLSRSRLVEKQAANLDALQIFNGFCNCSCKQAHPSVRKAMKCLALRNLYKCWICCQELAMDHPIENHLRTLHSENQHPGNITCPVCKTFLPYKDVNQHIYAHFNQNNGFLTQNSVNIFENETPVNSFTNHQEVTSNVTNKKRGRPRTKPLQNSKRQKQSLKVSTQPPHVQRKSAASVAVSEQVLTAPTAANTLLPAASPVQDTVQLRQPNPSPNNIVVNALPQSETHTLAPTHSELLNQKKKNPVFTAVKPASVIPAAPISPAVAAALSVMGTSVLQISPVDPPVSSDSLGQTMRRLSAAQNQLSPITQNLSQTQPVAPIAGPVVHNTSAATASSNMVIEASGIPSDLLFDLGSDTHVSAMPTSTVQSTCSVQQRLQTTSANQPSLASLISTPSQPSLVAVTSAAPALRQPQTNQTASFYNYNNLMQIHNPLTPNATRGRSAIEVQHVNNAPYQQRHPSYPAMGNVRATLANALNGHQSRYQFSNVNSTQQARTMSPMSNAQLHTQMGVRTQMYMPSNPNTSQMQMVSNTNMNQMQMASNPNINQRQVVSNNVSQMQVSNTNVTQLATNTSTGNNLPFTGYNPRGDLVTRMQMLSNQNTNNNFQLQSRNVSPAQPTTVHTSVENGLSIANPGPTSTTSTPPIIAEPRRGIPPPNVLSCEGCNQRFKSNVLFDNHVCF